MIIKYTDKIENTELGYILYLNLENGLEFWHNTFTNATYVSENAGELLGEEIVTLRELEFKCIGENYE